ncbi:MAG: GNAT family N-acetyltransferase [Proteobacteria bacterium]|nr:GNAT family N-acetyltransferase [Pseudomonadota bacterium]
MGVVVRPARSGEAATLTALCIRSKAHWAYDEAFMKLSAAALAVDEADIAAGRVLVAAAGEGAPLGMAAVLGDGETVDLDSLFVDPPAIGSGAGRLLFQAAIQRARDLGARFVRNAPSDAIPGRLLPLYEYDLTSGVEP